MELVAKDLDMLHQYKIRNSLDDISITQQYFFCVDYRMIYIKKSREYYKLMATSQCGFEPLYRESCLDVIAASKDLSDIISKYYKHVLEIIEVIK